MEHAYPRYVKKTIQNLGSNWYNMKAIKKEKQNSLAMKFYCDCHIKEDIL